MSQENVERIRTAFAGTTAGDFSYLPDIIDDHCEFLLPPTFPGTQATRGPDGELRGVSDGIRTRDRLDHNLRELVSLMLAPAFQRESVRLSCSEFRSDWTPTWTPEPRRPVRPGRDLAARQGSSPRRSRSS
jgi:hypothetical protein